MADDDEYKPKTGRLNRLARLASLSARLSTEVGTRVAKRLTRAPEEGELSILGEGGAEKLVATLGELKGLAMKLGQSLAMDPDLLTPEIRSVVARLQNQAPPMPYATVREVIAQELGKAPEEAYASFEPVPVASASLGQVHQAVTREGLKVAVKVQYPDIGKAIQSDLDNLGAMVSVVATTTRLSHGKAYFRELQEGVLEELNYEVEADRGRVYAEAIRPFPDLHVPRAIEELTRERVLTLEFVEGETLKEFLHHAHQQPVSERYRVARLLIRSLWGPFLCTGVVHADPHPGNFMLMSDGRLGVLDFGAIKRMSDPWTHANRKLVHSLLGGPPYQLLEDSAKAGMVFDDLEAARPFVQAVVDIACRSIRQEEFDYVGANINRDMRQHFMRNALTMRVIKPPKEAVQFFRAIGGMSHNLENLKAKGRFRQVFAEIFDTVQREGRALSGTW